MKNLFFAFKTVFKDCFNVILAASLSLNLLAVYYFIFSESTTFKVFFDSNVAIYDWLSIILTVVISLLFGITVTFLLWQWRQKISQSPSSWGNNFIGAFLGALSVGCPVCGAFLLSLLGIAGGLAVFPFQGLEIKAFSLILLGSSLFFSSKAIAEKESCAVGQQMESLYGFDGEKFTLNLNRKTVLPLLPAFLGFFLLFLTAYLPLLSNKYELGFNFQKTSQANLAGSAESLSSDAKDIIEKINPPQGVTINAAFGDIGPRLIAVGAIDYEKMKSLYERNRMPLTEEQIKILTKGSDEKIKITPENSYFLLNFFWAMGLANKNQILDEGQMTKYGADQIENFASTGGWTLGKKKPKDLYSKFDLIELNENQQKVLEDFADNAYRPCCSNPTSFPDCNHGMAALALGELMASQGASSAEIFEAFKYLNAFWFPQTYLDIAKYFEAKEGKEWSEVDARMIAGKDYSTPQGWNKVRNWLKANNLLEEAPSGGGGCGV